jgi:uronate dehydrogenase
MHILVTGAAGAIGRALCSELSARGDAVRGFDVEPFETAPCEFVQGDLEDAAAVDSAVAGVEGLVHMGAVPDEAPFAELVGPNLLGLYHVLDAARRAGVRRVILASTVQVSSGAPAPRSVGTRFPNNHYALTKLFAEDMGEMYARRFGLEVVAARVGWMVRTPDEARHIQKLGLTSWYLSRGDTARFVHAALHAPFTGFAVAYVVGPAGGDQFDLEPARRLFGFAPQDFFPAGLPFPAPSYP